MPTFATFRGHPDPVKRGEGTPGQITYCGLTFPLNEPVDVSSLKAPQLAKLLTNHNFVVVAPAAEPAAEVAAEPEPAPKVAKSPAKSPSNSPTPSSQDAAPAKLPQTPPAAPAAAVEASAATSSSPAVSVAAGAPVTMAKPVRPVGLTKAK